MGTIVETTAETAMETAVESFSKQVEKTFKIAMEGFEVLYTQTESFSNTASKMIESGSMRAIAAQADELFKGNQEQSSVPEPKGSIDEGTAGLSETVEEADESVSRFSKLEKVLKALKGILQPVRKLLLKIGSTMAKVGKQVLSIILPMKLLQKGFKKLGQATAFLTNPLKNLFKSLWSNIFNKGLQLITNGVTEGFANLTQYSSEFGSNVSLLKNSLSQLGNAFAAAAAPIYNAFAPAVNQIIQVCIKALNYVNQLLAALTGKDSWTRAKSLTDDYTDSVKDAGQAAKGALQPFDALNNLSVSGGGSGSGISAGDMFESVPLGSQFNDIADWLKEMWESADFTELGNTIGTKLRDALDSIPYDQLKNGAQKMAQRIATLINGFIETENLGYTIGQTLSEHLNTGFEFMNSFVHTFHFDSAGTFINEALIGALTNIDWSLIQETFVTTAGGIAEFINNLVTPEAFSAIGETLAQILNTVLLSGLELGLKINWENLGISAGTGINKFAEKFNASTAAKAVSVWIVGIFEFGASLLETTDFGLIGQKIGELLRDLNWKEIISAVGNFLVKLVDAAFELWKGAFDANPIATTIVTALGVALAGKGLFGGLLGSGLTAAAGGLGVGLAAVVGWFTGKGLGRLIFGNEAYDNWSWSNFLSALNFEDFTGAMQEMAKSAQYGVGSVAASLSSGITDVITAVGIEEFTEGVENANTVLDNMAHRSSAAYTAARAVLENFETETTAVTSSMTGALELSRDGLGSWSERFGQITGGIKEKLVNTFESVVSHVQNIGTNVIGGFISGIANKQADLYTSAQKIANNVKNTISKSLEIHSPSKVMFELGGYTMQGFQEGMESFYQPITASVDQFVGDGFSISPEWRGYENAAFTGTDWIDQMNVSRKVEPLQSISAGSNSKTESLLQQILAAIESGQEVSVQIDDREIARSVMRSNREYKKRYGGKPMLSY